MELFPAPPITVLLLCMSDIGVSSGEVQILAKHTCAVCPPRSAIATTAFVRVVACVTVAIALVVVTSLGNLFQIVLAIAGLFDSAVSGDCCDVADRLFSSDTST